MNIDEASNPRELWVKLVFSVALVWGYSYTRTVIAFDLLRYLKKR